MPRVLKSLELEDRMKNMIILEKWQEIVGENLPFIYLTTPNSLVAIRNKFVNFYK